MSAVGTTDKVVKLSDYNKLKSNYERLKTRNEKLLNKNCNLQEMVDNMIKNYESIKESKKATEALIQDIQKTVTLVTAALKSKEEYSTSTSSIEYINTIKRINSKFKDNDNNNNINLFLIKKFDELEINYNEICKSFNNTIKKYKFLKQDYDELSDNNIKLVQQIHLMNNEINLLASEVNEAQCTIERFKEIDKCLVDSTISNMVLNTNEHRRSTKEEVANGIKNGPYIICEPIPSFLKFINKTY